MDDHPVTIQRGFRRSVLIWLHLVRVQNRVGHDEYSLLSDHGLTAAQFDVLSHLASNPGISQQELAEHLIVTKGNVAGLLDRLELAGLVERQPDPDDRRRYHLMLTEAGRRIFSGAAPSLETMLDQKMDALTAAEQSTLLRLLAKLDRSLRCE
jgi:DNA-binding MarR family transcriptional regulator